MNKLILSILFTFVLLAYVIIDIVYNDEIWDASKQLAISMQQTTPFFERLVYEFFTYIVFIPPIAAFYCFVYDNNKLNSLLYLSVVVVSVTTNEILKNIYHQARPYMIEPDIKSLKCNSDYGKPSGHSQNSMVMLILMPAILFPSLKQLQRQKVQVEFQEQFENSGNFTGYTIPNLENSDLGNSKLQDSKNVQSKCKIVMKLILIIFILLSIVMTGLSRIFLGVHSIGQVLLGWVWGLYITLMYIFIIHSSLRDYIIRQLTPKKSGLEQMNHFIPISFLMLLALLGLSIGLLKLNSLVYYDDLEMDKWIQRINECQSTNYTRVSPQILYNSCLQFTGIGAMITGLLVGAVLVQGTYEEGLFNKWKSKIPMQQQMKRILLLLLPFLFLIPFLFIASNNVIIEFTCKIVPLSFGAGFIINGVYPYLLRRFNLQIPGDFLFLYKRRSFQNDQSYDSLQKHMLSETQQNDL
ncbi:unnamed protein product [Paramecium sonneborni]|uniref:Phosphatidic acid phosphatase type 2/haloperoxidase domain-containing protein n=1 Tax=Paramecium sonneborni TaxID=65129 RepID=A0A8S1QSF8_9CILI|nr:unnamed protein product [Paramecium sonneborni]